MDADGKNQAQVTTDPGVDAYPSWFPAGDEIAFRRRQTMWSIALESGREKPLPEISQDFDFPRLSPDGKQLAFHSKKSGAINIWTVPIEGGQPVQLTFDREAMGWPCWSPDGKFLAFEIKRGEDLHLAIIPSGGGEPTQLTFDRGQSWTGSWSPDGDKIAFAGFRHGSWNLWWVSRGTKAQKQVTNYSKLNAGVSHPTWSPRGDKIVYQYTETTGNIWLMNLK